MKEVRTTGNAKKAHMDMGKEMKPREGKAEIAHTVGRIGSSRVEHRISGMKLSPSMSVV